VIMDLIAKIEAACDVFGTAPEVETLWPFRWLIGLTVLVVAVAVFADVRKWLRKRSLAKAEQALIDNELKRIYLERGRKSRDELISEFVRSGVIRDALTARCEVERFLDYCEKREAEDVQP